MAIKIISQIILHPIEDEIVWTHYKNGAIVRQQADNEPERIAFQPTYPVDKDTFMQHISFKSLVALYEFNMTYEGAVKAGLIARHPETITERKERKQKWWEKSRDFKKLRKENEMNKYEEG